MARFRLAKIMALVLLTSVASACVDKPTEHRVRANAYLKSGDAKSALTECDLGLKEDPDNVALLVMRGKSLFELDRLDDAKVGFEKALLAGKSLEPKNLGEAHLGLAILAVRKKDYAEARKRFKLLVSFNAKDADAHINLARVCLQQKDHACAVKHGEEAGHLRGRSEDVLFTLGRIYLSAKKPREAEKTFSHICDVVKDASSCPYGIALVAAQEGDEAKALKKLKEAIDRKLPNPSKISEDPFLAPLKESADFKALVAGLTPSK